MTRRSQGRPSASRGARVERRKAERSIKPKTVAPVHQNRQERRAAMRRKKKGPL